MVFVRLRRRWQDPASRWRRLPTIFILASLVVFAVSDSPGSPAPLSIAADIDDAPDFDDVHFDVLVWVVPEIESVSSAIIGTELLAPPTRGRRLLFSSFVARLRAPPAA